MKKTLIAGAVAALIAAPVLAQTTNTDRLDQIIQELQQLKEKNERLEAEVEYLKANALVARKEAATEAVAVSTLQSTASVAASRYTWSGDVRYRYEAIDAEGNVTSRDRARLRLRFGVLAKVNDTVNARLVFSSVNAGGDNARSTNQTLGNGTPGNGAWDRKILGIDEAYVDWKASDMFNVQLGKMPMPWVRSAGYFWDPDLRPEGGAVKFARGPWFGDVSYNWLSEQDSGNNAALGVARSTDTKMVSAQFGLRQPVGKATLTAAVGYFDVQHVQDQPVTIAGAGCPTYAAANPAFGGSSYGNTTYTVGTPPDTCSQLLSGFNLIQGMTQLDFMAGKFPVSVFVDYMMNNDAVVNPKTGTKLDTAISGGFMFNKASAAKSWEAGVVYQKAEKDAVFGQFHDSDFGGGVTDTDGYVLKAAWVPATNWTLNGTYFVNKRFNDVAATNGTITTAKTDHDYERLQLDLNYKY